jgi:hypothetical protein
MMMPEIIFSALKTKVERNAKARGFHLLGPGRGFQIDGGNFQLVYEMTLQLLPILPPPLSLC